MSVEVLSLRSAGCLDPALVGEKATRLAAALQCGLPVLPGVVVPASVSANLLESAAREASSRGVHAARLSVMESSVPDLTDLEAQVTLLGDDLVVRSSSSMEAAPAYAGAFTSYLGVAPAEVATAVRGVWASALKVDDLASGRAGAVTEEAKPRMAVLVQPEVHPAFSGTARVSDGHVVTIVAVKGSPALLMAGWARGVTADVDAAGHVSGTAAVALVGEDVIRQVSELAVRVQVDIGDNLIEWGATDQGLVLLQAKRAASPAPQHVSAIQVHGPVSRESAAVARLLHQYAGPLGEALILPVLLAGVRPDSGTGAGLPAGLVTRSRASAAWMDAQALSGNLRNLVWGDADAEPIAVSSALVQLRQGDVNEVLRHLASLPAVDVRESDRLLVQLDTVARWLQQSKTLLSYNHFWAVEPSEVDDLIAGRASQPTPSDRREAFRRALLRWEPCVYELVRRTGKIICGEPVSAGVGAGLAVTVLGLPSEAVAVPRMVLVAPNPIPQLAPLLWGASALVTTGGSAAAHLVEVARSLGVAAVLGCDHEQLFSLIGDDGGSRTLIAVDGDRGRVVVDVHY